MPTPATYFTYRELFDRIPTKEELVSIVRGLNPFHTALLTARLSAMFRHSLWSKHPQDAKSVEKFQYWFATVFLDLETRQRLEARFGNQDPARRPVFHPLQFLQLMKLTLSLGEGDETARPDTSEFHRYQFGTACLMVNDLFLTEEEQQNLKVGNVDDRRKQLMLQWLASFEVSNPTSPRNLLFRSYATFRIVLRDSDLLTKIDKECGALNIEQDFETHFGITLMGFLSLVFGVQTMLLMNTQDDLLNQSERFLVNRKTILQDTTLTQVQIDNFFDLLSMSFEELRAEVRKERPVDERIDLVPFKSKSFFVTAPDNYACIDFAFVTEKMHNGPYFLLANKLPEDQRWKVFNAWGLLFEAYVNWLLRGLNGRHSALFFSDTHWEDGEKSFDAVFVKKRMVAVFEHKGGFLRQDARYANNLEKFTNDLQSKIGVGCKQLARHIGALFPETGTARRLRGVSVPSNTLHVLPVLVVQDLMLRTPFINYFLNQRFQAERSESPTKKGIEVLPLNVVQVTELENLAEMAEAFDFDVLHFLHRRCQISSDMLLELGDAIAAIPEKKLDRLSARFKEIYRRSEEEMCALLFKDPPETA